MSDSPFRLHHTIQTIIDRWKLRIEKMDESNYFVYGEVGPATRILFLIWSRPMRINGAGDYIDLYLKDNDPALAQTLSHDISVLVENLHDLQTYRFHE